MAETGQNEDDCNYENAIKNHTWLCSKLPKGQNSTSRPKAGVGAFINNKYINHIQVLHNISTEHTLWLQFLNEIDNTNSEIIYISITYSSPNPEKIETHKSIIENIRKLSIELNNHDHSHRGL